MRKNLSIHKNLLQMESNIFNKTNSIDITLYLVILLIEFVFKKALRIQFFTILSIIIKGNMMQFTITYRTSKEYSKSNKILYPFK
jgi:hypothetical protein